MKAARRDGVARRAPQEGKGPRTVAGDAGMVIVMRFEGRLAARFRLKVAWHPHGIGMDEGSAVYASAL